MQNIFLFCGADLLPFYRHYSFCTVFWVSSFYLSVNIVLYQFTVRCIENWSLRSFGQWIIKSKVYLLIIHARTEKKVQDCDYIFGSSTKFQRRMNGFVKADTCRQLSVTVFMYFVGFYLPLNPSATTVYARSAFYPSLRFTLSL